MRALGFFLPGASYLQSIGIKEIAVHCYQKRLTAYALLMATLTGCANHAAPSSVPTTQAARDAVTTPFRPIPVYILPSCKTHAGVRHCQWIEPRGHAPNSEARPKVESGQGIAI
jgi:hypothetical protein